MRAGLVLILLVLAAPASAQDVPEEEPTATPEDAPVEESIVDAPEGVPPGIGLRAGRRARDRGDFEGALAHFQVVYELVPGAEILLEIADVLGAMRRDGELRAAYRAFLTAHAAHARAEEIRARLAVLDAAAVAPPPEPPAPEIAAPTIT